MFTSLRDKDPFLAQLNSLAASASLDLPPGLLLAPNPLLAFLFCDPSELV